MADDDVVFPDGRSGEEYRADLRRFIDAAAVGEPPSADELSQAPLLRGWHLKRIEDEQLEKLLDGPVCQLWGVFKGHPFIEDGKYGHTSPVIQISPDYTWVRCTSRVYRLSLPSYETGLDLHGELAAKH